MWFKNLDKLMNYINNRPEFNAKVLYSTPSIYLSEINKIGATYPTKYDDFLPYADSPLSYWTGSPILFNIRLLHKQSRYKRIR